ncbi:MAG: hypothetical protein KGZ81_16135 [Flavobacteriales bacterium]|nr:hypothetical protein [Flavobacteriales bacterium]
MMNFQDDRKEKLSTYKKSNLTIEQGLWRDLPYDHILPLDQKEKNIIEGFRDDFWTYYKTTDIKLHQYFHHLNSSQALCFNLFFPLFHYDKKLLTYVLHRIIEVAPTYRTSKENFDKLLAIKNNTASDKFAAELEEEFLMNNSFTDCEFEKILDTNEATNFDFFVQLQKGHRVLFEIKYTENEFGKTVADDRHKLKYDTIYKQRLEKILRPEFLNQDFVFKNYQVVRNLSYIDDLTTVVFLFPEANQDLKGTEDSISNILLPDLLQQTRIVHLENLTRQILNCDYLKRLHPIYDTFKHIYID